YTTYSRYKFIEENKNEYIEIISEKLNASSDQFKNYVVNNNLQKALDTVMECIYTAAQCMKIIKSKSNKNTNKTQPWFDAECKMLRVQTLKALRKFRRLQTVESLRAYQCSKKAFRKATSDKKRQYVNMQTLKLSQACDDKDQKSFWNFLKGSHDRLPLDISAQDWFNYFATVYNPDSIDIAYEDVFQDDVFDETLDSPISNSEVFLAIKRLKNDKSPGLDGISAEFYKVISEIFVPYLVLLFNKMYDNSFFSEQWFHTLISPIHKSGDKSKPENYRGISLQPVISKIFTSILSQRLKLWCERNGVIGEEQAGFRSDHSTIDNLFCLQTIVQKYLRHKRGRLYAIFVDFEKAFDRVNRNILWQKLSSQNVSSKMVKMLNSIYTSVLSCVKTQSGLTGYFNCPVGVKQGCILSPLLFCLFINDLQSFVSVNSHGIDLDLCTIYLLLFADDLVMFADSKVELQRLINKLKEYCDTFQLKINIAKTGIIVFRNGGYLREYEKWFYGTIPLRVVSYYKYLGLVVSSRLSWYVCQKTLAEQASKALFSIKSKLSQFGSLSFNILFKIFDTKILPILTYGAEIWFGHESKDIEKVHHDYCKYILKVSKHTPNVFVRGELGRYSIYNVRCLKFIKYWLRILHMSNNRLPKICYKFQLKWLDANVQTKCWARDIRDLLLANGFGYAWYNQGVGNKRDFLRIFEQKLKDIDISIWFSEVADMSRLRTYRILKDRFCCETYLN
ncbi:MAG: reverse transcriptase family protein, partial [Candidatus Thiodiazotropha sp.]